MIVPQAQADIMSDAERRIEEERILEECFKSTKVLAKTLFPERFFRPFSKLHDRIFDLLDDESLQRVLILAPRGWGKSSCVLLAYLAKSILFRTKKTIVPISASETWAIMHTENLKNKLVSSPVIRKFFGPIESGKWSEKEWVTATGTTIIPRGRGQQIRGALKGDARPDAIILDDIETPEEVRSEDQRIFTSNWFFEDVCNSVDRGLHDWRIIVIGTLLHQDSLLANLERDPRWHVLKLRLCDENYKSNWPDFMTDAEVIALREEFRSQGKLESFAREYLNEVVDVEDASFRQEMFQDYLESQLVGRHVSNIVILDPAKTVRTHSDFTAIVGVGIDDDNHVLYVRDVVAGRLYPDEIYRETFAMCHRLHAKVLGVEVTTLNEFITYPIKNDMARAGVWVQLVELKPRMKKTDRIKQLVPFYRQGMVMHNKACCAALEDQLISFPHSSRDDIMDALAYTIELLDLGEKFFYAEETQAEVDQEYQELEELQELEEEEPDYDESWMVI